MITRDDEMTFRVLREHLEDLENLEPGEPAEFLRGDRDREPCFIPVHYVPRTTWDDLLKITWVELVGVCALLSVFGWIVGYFMGKGGSLIP